MPRRPSLLSLKRSIERLSPDDQQLLHKWLGHRLQEHQTRQFDGKTYVMQKRRCGQPTCTCMDGEISEVGHGPYWYAYWNQDGKTQSQYIGKRPPWFEM